jgi:ATP-binding cassette subfamily B protein
VATDRITLGRLIAFYVIMGLLQTRVQTAAFNLQLVFEGAEALLRLHRLSTERVEPPYDGSRRISFEGGIELQGIGFGYPRQPLFDGVDLSIRSGEIVALVGGNGAGKSTIASLVLGFYRPHRGTVLADGVPFDDLDLAHLRRQMGVVHQEPLLFPGTIASNIAYDRSDADEAAIERVARLATADLFVGKLPEGIATAVGEEGHLLSRGERQRIALARALLDSPTLLVLDEPTSNLDEEARVLLLEHLLALDPRPAMLLITHDPDLVMAADQVAVLRDGRIQARGAPETLSASGALAPVITVVGQ